MEEKNNRSIWMILFIGILCIVLQAGFQMLSWLCKTLILYDAGAMFATALLGIVPGLLTALLAGIITTSVSGVSFYFVAISFVLVTIAYYAFRHHFFQTAWTFILAVLLIGTIGGLGCSWLNIVLNNGGINVYFWMQDTSFRTLLIGIGMHILNILIVFLLIRFTMKYLPSAWKERIPFRHWVEESHGFFDPKLYHNEEVTQVRGLHLHTKVVLLCTAITVIAGFVLTFLSASIYRQHSVSSYGEIATRSAIVASGLIPNDEMDEILQEDGNKTEEYQKMTDRLNTYLQDSHAFITYLYVYQIDDSDPAHPLLRVIYDSDPEGNEFNDILDPQDDTYYNPLQNSPSDLASLESGRPDVSNGVWGWLMSVYEPLLNEHGEKVAYLGVDISMNAVMTGIQDLSLKILCVSVMIFLMLLAVVYSSLTYLVVKPIRRLSGITEAFRQTKLNTVDYSDPILSGDEFENLYQSIIRSEEIIVKDNSKMQEYVAEISRLAYRDELTGVKNKTSYEQKLEVLNAEIHSGTAEFAVVMIDMNELKQINDTYGHEKGDIAIRNMCTTICNIFAHSPVYRIGGDEFAVIMENSDYRNRDELMEELRKYAHIRNLDSESPWMETAVSYGLGVFDKVSDSAYSDVFNRADKYMYEVKKALKK